MRRTILTALFAFILAASSAALWADEGTGSGWGKITEVYVDAAGTVVRLQFSGDIVNPSGCEGGDFYVRELDDTIASDRFLRILMAAHLAGREVKFWVVGCSEARWWGKTRPQIIDIYIAD